MVPLTGRDAAVADVGHTPGDRRPLFQIQSRPWGTIKTLFSRYRKDVGTSTGKPDQPDAVFPASSSGKSRGRILKLQPPRGTSLVNLGLLSKFLPVLFKGERRQSGRLLVWTVTPKKEKKTSRSLQTFWRARARVVSC